MRDIAFVNGVFGPAADAVVSIDDRGFQFADSVYEVVVAFAGRPFELDAHLARLRRSMELTDMSLDDSPFDLPAVIREGLERCAYDEAMIYIQITRGVQPRSHLVEQKLTPTLVATFREKPTVSPEKRERGYAVMTLDDPRWRHCEIKSTALLPNVLARNRARREGFDDAVFIGDAGDIREATAANIFIVSGDVLVTPQANESILHGVTRRFIMRCAASIEIPVEERAVTTNILEAADEAFLSSTTVDIMPVTRVNNRPIADARPGPITRKLYNVFMKNMRDATRPT
jgi:D-alanine transaminase